MVVCLHLMYRPTDIDTSFSAKKYAKYTIKVENKYLKQGIEGIEQRTLTCKRSGQNVHDNISVSRLTSIRLGIRSLR